MLGPTRTRPLDPQLLSSSVWLPPPVLPALKKGLLYSLRAQMEQLVRQDEILQRWMPEPELDLDETTLLHIESVFSSRRGFTTFPDRSAPEASEQMKISSKVIYDLFSAVLLARLLIFQLFLETAIAFGMTEEHKKNWLLIQL
ncbi:hypothetical protein DFH09DRAFT_1178871, partial [Mycena vulgaris]